MELELHVEEKRKQEIIAKLKEELLDLLQWLDHLILQDGPAIEGEYFSVFGILERELHASYVNLKRVERKRELLGSALQGGEEIDLVAIELQLDMEFQSYLEELKKLEELYKKAMDRFRHSSGIGKGKSEAMKKLYRDFVKSFHPDLHGELTEEEKRLWLSARSAYKSGDLDDMKRLHDLLLSSKMIKEDVDYLEERIATIKERINQILLHPPLSWEIFLKGEEKEKRKAYLEELIQEYKKASEDIESEIALLSDSKGILH